MEIRYEKHWSGYLGRMMEYKVYGRSGKPVLLRLDLQADHGMGSPATQRNAQAADISAFLLWRMGKSGLKT